jgi:Protein of unknown function (DUF445)
LSTIVPNRAEIGTFVAELVAEWDAKTLVDRLEIQVGNDLQYIRINGTLVGGQAAMAQSLPTPSLASFDVHEFAFKPPQVYNDGSKTCRFGRKRRAELAMIFAFCAHSAA